MPDKPSRQGTLQYHKPNCKCPPCVRKAKTNPKPTGEKGREMDAEARLPEVTPQTEVVQTPVGVPVLLSDRSLEARTLQVAALRAKGLNHKQIAEKLGLEYSTVRNIVWRANKLNLIKYDDPYERFENQLVPKVVDNIEYWIDQKDKKMTIEAAKGAGIFKAHQAIKVEGDLPSNILALKLEMPPMPAGGELKVVTGKVVGKGRRELKEGE